LSAGLDEARTRWTVEYALYDGFAKAIADRIQRAVAALGIRCETASRAKDQRA
jgi:hypothetical protein